MRRSFGVRAAAALVGGALLLGAPIVAAAAEDDTTPPTGTLTINGGAAFTNRPDLTLDVPATDDASGVVAVLLSNDGTTWTETPYQARVEWYLPYEPGVAEGSHTVYARWRDGAGNESAPVSASISVDRTQPSGTIELYSIDDAARTLTFTLSVTDGGSPASGIGGVAFHCEDGPETVLPYATKIVFSLGSGGAQCAGFGEILVWVEVRDRVGNGLVKGQHVVLAPHVRFEFPRPAVTGQPFTIRPIYPTGFAPTPDTVCRTEFRWGDDASLFRLEFNETFGGLLFEGPASKGYCGEWTFTLPWVPYRQFDWSWTGIGSGARKTFTAAVGSTDRHIRSSNLPMVYVLPSRYDLVVGEPVTYTLYRLAGAGGGSGGRWVAYLVGSGGTTGTEHAFHKTGGSTFTFTPDAPGSWQVGWDIGPGQAYVLAGYYDPPARRRSGGGVGGGGGSAATAPPAGAASPGATASAPPSPGEPSADPTATGGAAATEPPRATRTPPAVAVASAAGGTAPPDPSAATAPGGAPPVGQVILVVAVLALVAGGGAVAARRSRRPS